MKISLESRTDINEIVSYDDNHIVIRSYINTELQTLDKSLILTPKLLIPNRQISIENSDDITFIETLEPEVIIISQQNTHYTPTTFSTYFSQKAIGVETMLMGPACRTYNLLAAEGRHVALLLDFN